MTEQEKQDTYNALVDEYREPLADMDMEYSDDGEISFAMRETPQEVSQEEPKSDTSEKPVTSGNTESGGDWEARFKGLQAKLTPTFQENAELKKRLSALEARFTEADQATQEVKKEQELRNELQRLYQEYQETGDEAKFLDLLQNASSRVTERMLQERLTPIEASANQQQLLVKAQQEAYDTLRYFGDKVQDLAPVVEEIIRRYPDAPAQYNIPQLYYMAEQVTNAANEQGVPVPGVAPKQEASPKAAPQAEGNSQPKADPSELAKAAARLNTETGVSPSVAVRGERGEVRPGSLEEAVRQAMEEVAGL